MSQVYQLAVHWGENKSDLFFEDKGTAEHTAEFINLMAENHYLKESKKRQRKKERKPVGQPVGAKVQGWPTNPKTKILNRSGKKAIGKVGHLPWPCSLPGAGPFGGDRLNWLSFLFWQIGNLKEQFAEAGGLRQVSP